MCHKSIKCPGHIWRVLLWLFLSAVISSSLWLWPGGIVGGRSVWQPHWLRHGDDCRTVSLQSQRQRHTLRWLQGGSLRSQPERPTGLSAYVNVFVCHWDDLCLNRDEILVFLVFWNIKPHNLRSRIVMCASPSACNCDPRGIILMGAPCDQISGDCSCKRYVTGRYCNQCLVSTPCSTFYKSVAN